jgi:hypothetical protein
MKIAVFIKMHQRYDSFQKLRVDRLRIQFRGIFK